MSVIDFWLEAKSFCGSVVLLATGEIGRLVPGSWPETQDMLAAQDACKYSIASVGRHPIILPTISCNDRIWTTKANHSSM